MSLDHPAEQAHCGRTAALAVELGRRAGVAAEPLMQAALLHHSLEPLRHSSGLGRLAWQVVAGDDARRIADIVQVCNLVDEQMEVAGVRVQRDRHHPGRNSELCGSGGIRPCRGGLCAGDALRRDSGRFQTARGGQRGSAGSSATLSARARVRDPRSGGHRAARSGARRAACWALRTPRSTAAAHRVSTVGRAIASVGRERGAQDHAGGGHAPAVCVRRPGAHLESFAERGSALFGAGQPHGSAEFGGRAGLRAGARYRRRGGAVPAARGAGDARQAGGRRLPARLRRALACWAAITARSAPG